MKKYKGSFFNGITLIGFLLILLLFIILYRNNLPIEESIGLILFTLIIFYLFSWNSFYYYSISDCELIIENSVAPWVKVNYQLINIDKIEFVSEAFFGIGVKITSNGKSKCYSSNNLSKTKLKNMVEEITIKIKNLST